MRAGPGGGVGQRARAQSHPVPHFPPITCRRSLTIRPALELQVRTGGKLERGWEKVLWRVQLG